MRNHIRDLLLDLTDAQVAFVVAGGVAVLLHGVERVTLDLDLAVSMDPDNLQRFLATMAKQDLHPRVPVDPRVLLDPVQVHWLIHAKHALVFTFIDRTDPLRQVDVFLTQEHGYDRLITDAVEVCIAGRTLCIASRVRLLAMKRAVDPPRPKDVLDIQELERLERGL